MFAVGLAIAAGVAFGWPRPAHAQSCGHLPALSPVPESQSCLDTCCGVHADCWASAGVCSVASDWPKGLATSCELCNQSLSMCAGMCSASRVDWLLSSMEVHDGCVTSCAEPGMRCGMPDGCGGVCSGDELCGFFVRRPEFLPAVLVW